jgi:predicted heme/steroid binding protein
MADSTESSLRHRKTDGVTKNDTDSPSPEARQTTVRVDDEDAYSPWLDVLRVLTFLFVASCGLSYLISSGETFFWGMKNPPNYLRKDWWETKIVDLSFGSSSSPAPPTDSTQNGPRYFTLQELAQYDGKDPDKPIYLSINGTVYDVTAGRRIYGPGGSYNVFAGVDASRGFVTGCFQEDRNGDMRGVEQMYLPLDNPEVDKHWSKEELKEMKKKELEKAKKKVHAGLKHWVDFFAKSKKYHFVGYLRRKSGWEGEWKKLCDTAQNGRTSRTPPGEKKEE